MPDILTPLLSFSLAFGFDARAMILALALIADSVFGDPPWLWRYVPHPVVVFGKAIAWADRVFNHKNHHAKIRLTLGVCAVLLLLAMAYLTGEAIVWGGALFANATNAFLAPLIIEFAIVTIMLAGGSLAMHVGPVVTALEARDLKAARLAISRIVGRNPDNLDADAISRAAIETTAENMSDGIIAPSLFYLLGGIPAMLAYKMLNTADSMLGHRTARHSAFGWGAARLDDIANLIPARVTALLIILATLPRFVSAWRGLRVAVTDSHKHASPNAGWAEAAMAGVLDVRLAGPRVYGSRKTKDAPLNAKARHPTAKDIHAGLGVMWRGVALLVMILATVALL